MKRELNGIRKNENRSNHLKNKTLKVNKNLENKILNINENWKNKKLDVTKKPRNKKSNVGRWTDTMRYISSSVSNGIECERLVERQESNFRGLVT